MMIRTRLFSSPLLWLNKRRSLLHSSNNPLRRQLSLTTSDEADNDDEFLKYIQNSYVVHRRGDAGHGSREYLLCPPNKSIEESQKENLIAGAILANRNILFGARSFITSNNNVYTIQQICSPLVTVAKEDASKDGEQPQAIASLVGLSTWVQSCLDGSIESVELTKLQKDKDPKVYEAVQAIATGIPRPGHSVVGIGTYRDGEEGWKAIAKEFVERGLSDEANLYLCEGADLVGIDHLADRNPEYLQSAGGAMARMFFTT